MSMLLAGALLASAAAAAGSAAYTAHQNRKMAKEAYGYDKEAYASNKAVDWYYDSEKYFDLDKQYSEYEYKLNKRYAENSAKWNVQGLRNAGLNPILAAQGAYSNVPQGMATAQHSSTSTPASHQARMDTPDLAGAISQGFGIAKASADIDQTETNTALQQEQIETEKMKQAQLGAQTANEIANGGSGAFSPSGRAYNSAKKAVDSIDKIESDISSYLKASAKDDVVELSSRPSPQKPPSPSDSDGGSKWFADSINAKTADGHMYDSDAEYRRQYYRGLNSPYRKHLQYR